VLTLTVRNGGPRACALTVRNGGPRVLRPPPMEVQGMCLTVRNGGPRACALTVRNGGPRHSLTVRNGGLSCPVQVCRVPNGSWKVQSMHP